MIRMNWHLIGTYGRYKNEENVTESEKKLLESIYNFFDHSLFYGAFGDGVENNKGYYKSLEALEQIYGKKALDYSNYNTSHLERLSKIVAQDQIERDKQENENNELKYFKEKNKITLDAKTVQFDMANNLDSSFGISGTVELKDYYNYGFDNEKSYFSTYIVPDEGKYSDGWYLYFSRKDFETLFNEFLKGKKHILVEAKIPSYMYEKGQGRMAMVYAVEW